MRIRIINKIIFSCARFIHCLNYKLYIQSTVIIPFGMFLIQCEHILLFQWKITTLFQLIIAYELFFAFFLKINYSIIFCCANLPILSWLLFVFPREKQSIELWTGSFVIGEMILSGVLCFHLNDNWFSLTLIADFTIRSFILIE